MTTSRPSRSMEPDSTFSHCASVPPADGPTATAALTPTRCADWCAAWSTTEHAQTTADPRPPAARRISPSRSTTCSGGRSRPPSSTSGTTSRTGRGQRSGPDPDPDHSTARARRNDAERGPRSRMNPTEQSSEMDVWTVDARTGQQSGPVATNASDADVNRAAQTAVEAWPALKAAGLDGRARLLRDMADQLEKDGDAIIDAADRETALGPVRLRGELGRTAYPLRLQADVRADGGYLDLTIDHPNPAAIPAPTPDLPRMMVPIGPVGVFSASNFPLAFSVPAGDTASAIAAASPVLGQAHPPHPLTSELALAALRPPPAAAE